MGAYLDYRNKKYGSTGTNAGANTDTTSRSTVSGGVYSRYKAAKNSGAYKPPATRRANNTYGVDDEIWSNVRDYGDAIGDYDWRSEYEYNLLDSEDLRRKSQGLIPLALEDRYDLDDALDRALYSEGLPSSKDIAKVAEEAQEQAEKNAQEQRLADSRSTFRRMYQAAYEKDANKYNELEDEIATLVKLEEKASKDPESREYAVYNYIAGAFDRAEARNKQEAAQKSIQQQTIDTYGYMSPEEYNAVFDVNDKALEGEISALQPEIAQLAQQYDAIDEQISYITASPYGMDESRAQELEALRRRQAQIKSQMDAVNTQAAGLEQQRIEISTARREAEISAALQQYADIPNAADFERYAQQGAQTEESELFNSSGRRHNLINLAGNSDAATLAAWRSNDSEGTAYTFMTDDERGIYNYLYAKEGKSVANEYLNALDPVLNVRWNQNLTEGANRLADEMPVVASALSVGASIPKAAGAAYALVAGDNADPYDPLLQASTFQSTVRGNISEDLGGVGGFFYNAGMSMLDTLLTSGTGGKASAAIMGAGAMADTYQAALERGADPTQALAVGAMAAVSEAVFEKYSIERWVNLKSAGRGAAVKNVLKTMGIEASEEMATEVANIVSDVAIMGKLGETHGKSVPELLGQIGLAGAGGAFSGGGFGVLGNISNRINTNRQAAAEQAAAQQAEASAQQAEASPEASGQIENAQDTGAVEAEQAAQEEIAAEEVSEAETPEQAPPTASMTAEPPRAGRPVTPGLSRQATPAALQQAARRLAEASGKGVNNETMREASGAINSQLRAIDALAKRYGIEIELRDSIEAIDAEGNVVESALSGHYDPQTRRITIAADATDQAYTFVATHELVHYIKDGGGEGYSTLEATVFEALEAAGEDVEGLIRQQMDEQGYDEFSAREEVVANSVPAILTDEATVRRIVETDRTLAERIADFFKGFAENLRNIFRSLAKRPNWTQMESISQQADAMESISNAFFDALEEAAAVERTESGAGDIKASIKHDKNNTPFVVVEDDVLAGVEQERWVKTVKDNLKERFPDGIIVGNNEIDISSKSAKEMTYSKYTRYLMEHEPELYADKLRATNNADEIIKASREYVNEALNHPRKDDIQEFARGKVNLRVGGNDYSADVVVAMRKNGRLLLYDILAMNETDIVEKNGRNKPGNLTRGEAERSVASNENITQGDAPVKASVKEGANIKGGEAYVDTEQATPRDILAGAFAGIAQGEQEQKFMESYKAAVASLNEKQTKLDEASAKLKTMRSENRKLLWDGRMTDERRKAADDLQKYVDKLAKQVDWYDKRLLSLENSKPLKDLVARERKKVARKKAQQYRKWKAEDRAAREKRELRRLIQSRAKELLNRMTSPTEKSNKYVPEKFQNDVVEVLRTIRFTSEENAEAALAKRKKKLDEVLIPQARQQYDELVATNAPQGDIEKAFKKLQRYLVETENVRNEATKWRGKLQALLNSIGDVEVDKGEAVQIETDTIQQLRELLDETNNILTLDEMTVEQLRKLNKIMSALKHSIVEANRITVDGKKRELSEMGRNVITEAQQSGKLGKKRTGLGKLLNWSNIKPVYAFKRMGSTLRQLFDDVANGQRTYALNMSKAHDYYRQQYERFHVADWINDKKKLKFTTQRGDTIELSRNEALSLYATAKREAVNPDKNARHLSVGGFVFEAEQTREAGEIEVNGKKKKVKKTTFNDATPKPITESDMETIKKWLTKEQMAFADELVNYMSTTLADLGNETSLKQSGFKKFGESYYFPYKSSPDYVARNPGEGIRDNERWRHKGFTKATVAGARNPIVLQNFTDVFGQHVNDMLMYHAMAIPQENLLRVFNWHDKYSEDETSMAVSAALKNAYGPEAVKYIDNFLADLNGGLVTDPREGDATRRISQFKKGATMASLSVIVQQPSALVRGMALVNPRYFVVKPKKGSYEQLMKYSGTAVIKRMGGFDTGTGKGSAQWITSAPPKGVKNKAREFVSKDSAYRDDVLGAAPQKMDEFAWSWIWEAVKRETAAKMGIKPGDGRYATEEHLQAAGRRFDDVIEHTQVYDSVISRSELMRSQSGLLKMVTAFGAEPTVAYNMFYDAVASRNVKHAGAYIGAVVVSSAVNALLKSFVTAARDDDEEKDYWEKYGDALKNEVLGQPLNRIPFTDIVLEDEKFRPLSIINPLTMVPAVRDVISMFQGYDVERTDMSLFDDLITALDNIDSDRKSDYEKWRDMAGAIANMTGIPLKNVLRDVEAVLRLLGVEL